VKISLWAPLPAYTCNTKLPLVLSPFSESTPAASLVGPPINYGSNFLRSLCLEDIKVATNSIAPKSVPYPDFNFNKAFAFSGST
jgi:hypothetical protein